MNLINTDKLYIGIKQVKRMLSSDTAECVFIAKDANTQLTCDLVQMAMAKSVPVSFVPTMRELGKLCQIDVGAAAAVIIK